MTTRVDAGRVRKAQRGDDSAWAYTEKYCRELFRRTLGKRGLDEDAREEIAQQALTIIVAKLPEFRWAASFETWAIAIVLRVCQRYVENEAIRHRRLVLTTDMNPEQQEGWDKSTDAPGGDPPAESLRLALREALADCLQRVSFEMREVWARHRLSGWKHQEIAAKLSLPVNTVSTRVRRVDVRMRTCLESKGFTAEALGLGA